MINKIFIIEKWREKIQQNLPLFFQAAEMEASRNGTLGPEIGTVRERVLIGMLMHFYNSNNVQINIPSLEKEIDVGIHNKFYSIKTVTTNQKKSLPNGFKLIWTADQDKALEFGSAYSPECDILFVHINWRNTGGLYLFPQKAQLDILNQFGRDKYIKIPNKGTNSRGVEIHTAAVRQLVLHNDTKVIPIQWKRQDIKIDIYKRHQDVWNEV